MDGFMWHVLGALREHGKRAVNVFPPAANVLLSFSERLANEVVCAFLQLYTFDTHFLSRSVNIYHLFWTGPERSLPKSF